MKALVIYLISNLMKLTVVIPYEITMASLGNSIIKRATLPKLISKYAASAAKKNAPTNCWGVKFIYAQFVE